MHCVAKLCCQNRVLQCLLSLFSFLCTLLRSSLLSMMITNCLTFSWLVGSTWCVNLLNALYCRDPNLQQTLDRFAASALWAANGEFTDRDIDEAKLAVFSQVNSSYLLVSYTLFITNEWCKWLYTCICMWRAVEVWKFEACVKLAMKKKWTFDKGVS